MLGQDAGALSQRALRGLKSYSYKAGGYTWLDDAHQPFWNLCVSRLPMWLAPNLITLLGTLCIASAYALNILYNPSFTGEAPTWVYVWTAASVALYVNLDCMDGKQARRTGSSSPLGQLFDHGCDAMVLHMMLGNIAASLGVGCGWKMAAGCLGIMVPWILAQWEEYHTGIMMYGNAMYGVLEANYSICAVHLISATLGLGFWRTEVTLPAPISQLMHLVSGTHEAGVKGLAASLPLWWQNGLPGGRTLPGGSMGSNATMVLAPSGGPAAAGGTPAVALVHTSLAELALVVVGLAGVVQGVTNVLRVFSAPPLPQQEAGHKLQGKSWAALHLAGLLATVGLGACSVAWSPCGVSVSHQAHGSAPDWGLLGWDAETTTCRASFSTFGVLYALAATQLIMAHMAKEPWAPSVVALAVPAAHVLCALLGWPAPALLQLVLSLHVLALAVYANYVGSVISQVCAHLGIKCLTITPQPPQPQRR